MKLPDKIRIGTRGSRLALIQTDLWIARVRQVYPQMECEKVIIKTEGDRRPEIPLQSFDGQGIFVKEIEKAIANGTIDCAVHSAKDMPSELQEDFAIVSVLPRADVRDVLVTRKENPVTKDRTAVIGTGSLRRQRQMAEQYPFAKFENLRGNVGTRLEQLRNKSYDGILLAAAGLQRLRMEKEDDLDYFYFDAERMVPAGGQAVIAVEGKCGRDLEFLKVVSDEKTELELDTERRILKGMQAGCHEAAGVYAKITGFRPQTDYVAPSCLMTGNIGAFRNEKPQIAITAMRDMQGELRIERVQGALVERLALADELIARMGGLL